MEDNDREQFEETIAQLKEEHADEVEALNEKIGDMEQRIIDLQDAIEEIYNIAKKI